MNQSIEQLIAQIEQDIKDKQKELEELKKAIVYNQATTQRKIIRADRVLSNLNVVYGLSTSLDADKFHEWILLDAEIRKEIFGKIEYGKLIRQLYGRFIEEKPDASSIMANNIVKTHFTEEKIKFWLDNM